MNIAICDDEKTTVCQIINLLTNIGISKEDIHVFETTDELTDYIQNNHIHILFMDIVFNGSEEGIETIKQVNMLASDTQVIYISWHPEYFEDVYATEHVFFLGKPIHEDKFTAAFKKAAEKFDKQNIVVQNGLESIRIDLRTFCYAESRGHNIDFHFRDGSVLSRRMKMSVLEELEGYALVRCHRSFLVNIRQIETLKKNHIYISNYNNTVIPIGRKYEKTAAERILRFWGGLL